MLIFWDGSNLNLSEDLKSKIVSWKEKFQEIKSEKVGERPAFIEQFIKLLAVIEERYQSVFANRNMFYEFMEHSGDVNYLAAVKLLEFVVYRQEEEKIRVKQLLTLLANKKMRAEIFGF